MTEGVEKCKIKAMDFQNRKKIIYWALILILAVILTILGYLFFYSKLFKRPPATQEPTEQEKTLKENLDRLTAPSAPAVSQEIIDRLTAPAPASEKEKTPEVSEDVLKRLSAPLK